jgi:3-methyladenine DNA glycosylase/8-oxoguanine DNA glycosylase
MATRRRRSTSSRQTLPPTEAALARADPVLGRWIDRIGACRLAVEPVDSLVAALGREIIGQQLALRAAAVIHARVVALGRRGFPDADELQAMDESILRGAGLSATKARALKEAATRVLDGTLPSLASLVASTDDEIVEALTQIRGVGPWTAHMLLIFRLGRPDVLPTADYGIRKGFQRVFRTTTLPTPAEIRARGERWRPWRSMASWYLWRSLDAGADVIPNDR